MPRSPATDGTDASGPAGPPRSAKGAETRARLIDAAKRVFERDGFLDARIADIADEGGVSHGSFYHYFDSKGQVFREVAAAQEERLTATTGSRSADREHVTPRARIGGANRRYLERYRAEAALMGVIEEVSRYDTEVNAARMNTMKHFAERSEQSIRRLQRDGLADPGLDPAFAADALASMVARIAELWLVQGYADYAFDDAVEQLTRLWANALGLPPEATGAS